MLFGECGFFADEKGNRTKSQDPEYKTGDYRQRQKKPSCSPKNEVKNNETLC
jgi:hypothetical protein